MKSSEGLESRLTAFLLESALKLADLISADVFVLVDSPGSSYDDDDPRDESNDRPSDRRQCRGRGVRIWSGASSLRSAFLRDGLRVRESDVEFASAPTPSTTPPPASGFGCVEGGKSADHAEDGSIAEDENHYFEEYLPRPGVYETPRHLFPSGVARSTPLQSSPTSPTLAVASSSSRRKRRPPSKRKTRLKPKFSRLNIDDDNQGNNNHDDDVVDVGDFNDCDDNVLPLNLSFIDKPQGSIKDDRSDASAAGVYSSRSPREMGAASSISSSSAAPPITTCSPLLSASLPTPVSPNQPSSSPLPPLETGSSATARELFDFSFSNHDPNLVSSPNRNDGLARLDVVGCDTEKTNGPSDDCEAANLVGLMDLTPPERDLEGDEKNHDGNASPGKNTILANAMERAMAAAAAAAAVAQAPTHAVYGMSGSSSQPGCNDDYYANITHSLFSMLSHYSPAASSSRKSENAVIAEDGRVAGEGTSSGGGGGSSGGGGRGGRKRRESSPVAERKIDALLSEKSSTVEGDAQEKSDGASGCNSNGTSSQAADETLGNRPGRPRGRTSSENRRGQKPSSSHTRRPFTCSLCKKTFTRKDTCREHLKRIHFREVLHCQVCNMAFNSRQTMWFHRKKTGHQYEIVPTSLPDPEHTVENNQS